MRTMYSAYSSVRHNGVCGNLERMVHARLRQVVQRKRNLAHLVCAASPAPSALASAPLAL